MSTWEQELQAAIGFLADQIDDLRLLLRSTPDEVLEGTVGQSLMRQSVDVMSVGVALVSAHMLLAQVMKETK